jgi:glycosyltransferase involved in cell wall biosynthesis
VAYVGPFGFPEGGAAARRIVGMARTFDSAGFDVVVASGQAAAADALGRQDGIAGIALGERDAEHLPRPLRRLRYGLMGRRTCRWLESRTVKPDLVVLYSGYSPYLLRVGRWCRRNGIPFVFDAVEWYSPGSWFEGATSPYYWNIEFAMRALVPRTDGVIAISTWLERYYQEKGIPVVRVPPTLDVQSLEPRLEGVAGKPLRLCYAGTPGAKDDLDSVAGAVLALDPSGESVVLDIAGVGPDGVSALPSVRRAGATPPALRAHGYVDHASALALVRSADFSVLLRPPGKVAQAGFPTKFVESLAVGTPVIANLTSDLALHLREGVTGIVCEDAGAAAFAAGLRRALHLSSAEVAAMRQASRRHAEAMFDFRHYAGDVSGFVARLQARTSEKSRAGNA